ncbi:MAG TPA: efflux transporter outer membrane subunit [Stellaceae bacterium]|nr:efflux transporter outer membrane subunit [Stellaceae bacterium]
MPHAEAPLRSVKQPAKHRPRGKTGLVLALCLVSAGCSLVPDYQRPQADAAAAWSTAVGDGTGAVPVSGAWWRSFGSPELDELMQRSLSGNFTLRAAVARIDEAQGTAEVNAAALFPSITVAGTQDQKNGVKNTGTHQLLAQASYELDFWGKNRAAAASGTALAHASAFDADTVAMTLSASLVDTYFQILSLNERVRLARQIADDARHVLALVQVQQQAGTATELQVEQQRAAVATFDGAVPPLLQQADQALHLLAVLTGQAPEGFAIAASDLHGLARPGVLPDLPTALLERRPDIRAAEARLISANFDIGVARAAFFPSVSLNAGVGIGAKQASHFFPPSAVTDLGFSLLQPLFQGGQLEGQLRFDRARQVEMVATYRQTVIAAFQDVEDMLSTLAHVRDQEEIEIVAQTAASRAASLAELQYRLGSADYLTVLTTEQALYQAQDALLQVRLQRLQAIVGLFRALGGGFDADAGPAVVQVSAPQGARPQSAPQSAAPSAPMPMPATPSGG